MHERFIPRKPCRRLAAFVASFWYFEGVFSHSRERVLPTGSMQLLVNLHEDELRSYHGGDARRISGAGLCGAHSQHFEIDTASQRAILGANFAAGGAAAFFRVPAGVVTGDHVDLETLWGREGAVLRERLLAQPSPFAQLDTLERALLEKMTSSHQDPATAFAVKAFERGARVGDVADRLGLSPRRLGRRFNRIVGLSPKRFARVQRFRTLIEHLDLDAEIDWAREAATGGYSDQAHLIHEFRDFAGVSPTEYRPRSSRDRGHVPVDG